MEQALGKKYKLKNSENFEDYMKFIEIGLINRKAATALSPVATLTRNADGSFTYTMASPIKTTKITFKLGEEFVEERLDGAKVKSVIVMEGDDTMIQTQIEDNGRKSVHVRKFTPTSLTVTTTAEGWDGTCVRSYEVEA